MGWQLAQNSVQRETLLNKADIFDAQAVAVCACLLQGNLWSVQQPPGSPGSLCVCAALERLTTGSKNQGSSSSGHRTQVDLSSTRGQPVMIKKGQDGLSSGLPTSLGMHSTDWVLHHILTSFQLHRLYKVKRQLYYEWWISYRGIFCCTIQVCLGNRKITKISWYYHCG
jgi:hypothetical protein